MIYKATNLIMETFDLHNVKYRVNETEDASVVEAGFIIEAGPQATVHFISTSENNDVTIRIFGLIYQIPADRRGEILDACNTLNAKYRFIKFFLDTDSNVNVQADLPVRTDDECLGECCFELFARIMHMLRDDYHVLAEALYRVPCSEKKDSAEFLKALLNLKEKPLIVGNEDASSKG
ncbi:MAG: YbjN domain-containing protein [Oscillospiraceae bacterium]|nr:YbjN domain-containing protein [Oscillospiraceae bacterium]